MKSWPALFGVLALACSQQTSAAPANPSLEEELQQYVGPGVCAKREQCGTLASNGYADKQACIDKFSMQAAEIVSDESVRSKCSAAMLNACADKYATVACAAGSMSDAPATDDCIPCGFPTGK